MTNPQVAIDIVANDKSAKGTGSAEKRLDHLGGHARKIGKDVGKVGGLGNIGRTFGEVDRAANEAFGTRSIFGTIGKRAGAFIKIGSTLQQGLGRTATSFSRVSAVGEGAATELGSTAAAGEAAAGGLGEAAEAAGGLAVALGPVAVVATAVVATLGAAAVAGYKFAAGWAASTAQMGRFAETIGVASRDLQELQGAAERYGIGKDATNSAVSSFAQTAHDAYYARNPQARVLLRKLGVNFAKGPDGNLDYSAMLSQVSRGLAAQRDPQAALQAAQILGVSGLLPLLRKGPNTLGWEKADVAAHGVVNSDADIDTAKKFTRSATLMSQMAGRAMRGAQAWTAAKYEPALDKGVTLGRDAIDGKLGDSVDALGSSIVGTFAPAADKIDRAADKMLVAAGRLSGRDIDTKARQGASLRDKLIAHGFRPDDATALAANAVMESNGRFRSKERLAGGRVGPGRGLWQWTDAARKANFRRVMGVDVENSNEDQQIEFLKWELTHSEARNWRRAHAGGSDPGSVADGFARYVERPRNPDRDAEERRSVADAMAIPVRVEIDARGLPSGTKTKVTAGRGTRPAISYAMQH